MTTVSWDLLREVLHLPWDVRLHAASIEITTGGPVVRFWLEVPGAPPEAATMTPIYASDTYRMPRFIGLEFHTADGSALGGLLPTDEPSTCAAPCCAPTVPGCGGTPAPDRRRPVEIRLRSGEMVVGPNLLENLRTYVRNPTAARAAPPQPCRSTPTGRPHREDLMEPNDPAPLQLTQLMSAATAMYEIFVSLQEAGFTEAQALTLLGNAFNVAPE